MNSRTTGIAAVVALLLGSGIVALEAQRPSSATWITAWGSSQQGLGMTTMTNAAVRIRLDNTFGTSPLAIGRMYVGQRVQGPALATGSNRQAFFNRSGSVTIPPGGSVVSDPVQMKVNSWEDLAVSLYIPETNVVPSQHGGAVVTSYVSANGSGDVAAGETRAPFTATTTSMFWLKAID